MRTHRAPTRCPVCSDSLITLQLGCPSCGTQLSGHFANCEFCRLGGGDLEILRVFLRSRGNIRDVQAHLGVSYPTARARLIDVLDRLGLGEEAPPAPEPPAEPAAGPPGEPVAEPPRPMTAAVLADLAAGRIDVDRAEALLGPS